MTFFSEMYSKFEVNIVILIVSGLYIAWVPQFGWEPCAFKNHIAVPIYPFSGPAYLQSGR